MDERNNTWERTILNGPGLSSGCRYTAPAGHPLKAIYLYTVTSCGKKIFHPYMMNGLEEFLIAEKICKTGWRFEEDAPTASNIGDFFNATNKFLESNGQDPIPAKIIKGVFDTLDFELPKPKTIPSLADLSADAVVKNADQRSFVEIVTGQHKKMNKLQSLEVLTDKGEVYKVYKENVSMKTKTRVAEAMVRKVNHLENQLSISVRQI